MLRQQAIAILGQLPSLPDSEERLERQHAHDVDGDSPSVLRGEHPEHCAQPHGNQLSYEPVLTSKFQAVHLGVDRIQLIQQGDGAQVLLL